MEFVIGFAIGGIIVFAAITGYACMRVSGDCSEYERQVGLDNGI